MGKGGEKISIKLQHRLQRFIIVRSPSLLLFFFLFIFFILPLSCFITSPRWYDHRCCCCFFFFLLLLLMPNRRPAGHLCGQHSSRSTACLAFYFSFFSQSEILMVRRTTSYWLTVDMSVLIRIGRYHKRYRFDTTLTLAFGRSNRRSRNADLRTWRHIYHFLMFQFSMKSSCVLVIQSSQTFGDGGDLPFLIKRLRTKEQEKN